MKFVGLTSGGKDSYYSIMECMRNGHTLVACAHLAPHPNNPAGEESYMYQTAASEAVQIQVEECLGVPLLVRACRGKSRRTTLVYELEECNNEQQQPEEGGSSSMDEVEDMFELLKEVQRTYPEVEAVSSGAILSTYQRLRVESVCQRLGWTSLGYLWRAGTQRQMLDTMLADQMEAVLVRVACPPLLLPHRHLNKTLRHLQDCGLFPRLEARLDFAVCGEGGEYETLVLDCPIFLKRLVLDSVSIQVDDNSDDGIGVLKIHSCHAEPKESSPLSVLWNLDGPVLCDRIQRPRRAPISSSLLLSSPTNNNSIEPNDTAAASLSSSSHPAMTSQKTHYLAQYKILSCGLVHMSEITSSKCYPPRKVASDIAKNPTSPLDNENEEEAEMLLAVQEALNIFEILQCTLQSLGLTTLDVVFVHLYLADMRFFEKINRHYSAFFGTVLPPSRSCVSLGPGVLPGGRRVSLDCMAQRGSGLYLRSVGRPKDAIQVQLLPEYVMAALENRLHPLRSVLHVQSISHWAPVCVGPYSQCNTLRSSIHCLAGQIGLQPRTMTLVDHNGTLGQLAQCWTNCASVLDALDGSTLQDSILGATIYLTQNDHDNNMNNNKGNNPAHIPLSQACIANNGGIISGAIDTSLFGKQQDTTDDFGGYEDEETYLAMTGGGDSGDNDDSNASVPEMDQIPLLTLVVSQMPKGALAEVELICATQLATSFLNVQTHVGMMPPKTIQAISAADPFWASTSTSSNSSHEKSGVQWNTGYDAEPFNTGGNTQSPLPSAASFDIFATCRYVGSGCATVVTVAAAPSSLSPPPQEDSEESRNVSDSVVVDMEEVIYNMFLSYHKCLHKAGLQLDSTFHIRFFYDTKDEEDGMKLRQTVQAVVGSMWKRGNRPAYSMVPVQGILLSHNHETHSCGWAMQIMAADLLHMETDRWVHHHHQTV